MKILIFEYIVGGGLAKEQLPDSLMKEGQLMLQTLACQLAVLPNIQLTVLLDWRCSNLIVAENIETILVTEKNDIYQLLAELINRFDMVWPIAPEMNGVLKEISILVENTTKHLLNSSSLAIAICTDKLLTSQLLKAAGIDTIETTELDGFSANFDSPVIIKLKDGVGCLNSYLISNKSELNQITKQIDDISDYIVQPFIKGELLSLSCVFKDAQAWLICCNKQLISIRQQKFILNACIVNLALEDQFLYQKIIDQVALNISGLWGYVGIDIILPEVGPPLVVDINPRLTTSYVGIKSAIGVNLPKVVIEMLDKPPEIIKTKNKQVTVSI